MQRSRRRGFSLLELMLAGAIMVVMGAFGLYSLVRGHESAQSRGLAEEIAEEIKAARQQAVSTQIPVALAFPSAGRSTGASQTVYQLEGHNKPRISRSVSYADTYPDSCMFWGAWGTSSPDALLSDSEFNLTNWAPLPRPDDYLLVFTPSGKVRSNGLPVFDGEYRLLVSNGVEGTTSPTAVSKPYTVAISKVGGVTVSSGVTGGVGIPDRPTLAMGTVANGVPAVAPVLGGPTIRPLRSQPTPQERSRGGALTAVPEEGFITVIVDADDPSGEPLTMSWTATDGQFSYDQPMAMSWDVARQCWTGRTAWTPPPGADEGDIFNITCTVTNPRGDDDSAQLDAGSGIEVVLDDKIANVSADGNYENFYLSWMNPEGNNVHDVTVPRVGDRASLDMTTPVWSPNGDKLAFYAWESLGGDAIEAICYLVNEDGTNLRQLFTTRGDLSDYSFGPSFSPDGARVTFSAYEDPDEFFASRVWVCNIFGASPTPVKCTGEPGDPSTYSDHVDVTWHPTADYILYTATIIDRASEDVLVSGLRVADVSNLASISSRHVVRNEEADGSEVPAADQVGEAHWSHDGEKFVYVKGNGLYVLRFDAANGWAVDDLGNPMHAPVGSPQPPMPAGGYYPGRSVGPPGVDCAMPRFSPDNNLISVIDVDSGNLWVVRADGGMTPRRVTTMDVFGYNWSPDGDEIVFSTLDEKMYVVSAAGGAPKEITPPTFQAWTAPSWWKPAP